jgi:hypothetical protein
VLQVWVGRLSSISYEQREVLFLIKK